MERGVHGSVCANVHAIDVFACPEARMYVCMQMQLEWTMDMTE